LASGFRASVVTLGLASGMVASSVVACERDTDLSGTLGDAGTDADAALEAGPMVTVTTLAPRLTLAPAMKASATWAAYRLDDGDWHALSAASEGTYTFPFAVARWTLALVCASPDDALVTVFLHHRTNATPAVEVTLDESCTTLPPPAEYAFTGTLTNIPTTTQWFDFGYARTSRGEAIPVSGATGTYEIVGIEPGTWDLSFAVRDEPFRAITRFVMKRAAVVKSDAVVDVDLTGPGSFAPASKSLRLHSLIKGDTVAPVVFYGAGGPLGIDVGPQDVPDETDVTLAYSTVPPSAQAASDRYYGELKAEQDRRTGSRMITFDVHEPLDLDLTFLPDAPASVVSVVATSPSVRLATKFPVLADAERHEVVALAARNRRTQLAFRSTYDAIHIGSAAEVDDVTPDLSAVPGWKAAWGLPGDVTMSVFVTSFERPLPLGDGKMQRSASRGQEVSP
jgi:hypothetical protein